MLCGFCVYTNPNANVCSIIDVYHEYAGWVPPRTAKQHPT